MLLTPKQLTAATKLTTTDISVAFKRNGYEDEVFESAEYKGMNTDGCFVYEVTYCDYTPQDIVTCNVYVKYSVDPVAKTVALIADY